MKHSLKNTVNFHLPYNFLNNPRICFFFLIESGRANFCPSVYNGLFTPLDSSPNPETVHCKAILYLQQTICASERFCDFFSFSYQTDKKDSLYQLTHNVNMGGENLKRKRVLKVY